jgi:hypothetical protein
MNINLLFTFLQRFKKIKNNRMFSNLLFKEQFKFLKTTHSYHLVDPSPWRATDRCARPFLTQEIHLSSCALFLRKPLTRIFYLYTDYYLGLACQFTFLSTAGHTGKRLKKVLKPVLSNTLIELIVVQIFLTSAKLFLMGNRSLRMLGKGIRGILREILGSLSMHSDKLLIPATVVGKVIGEVRENSFLC